MTPEVQAAIARLEQRIVELEDKNKLLEAAHSIPLELDQAIRARFAIDKKLEGVTTASATTQAIDLTGNAQTITVPAQPAGVLRVTYNGQTFNLLFA